MHEDIDEDEHPPVEQQRDTELTLGPMLLLGLFFGLVLLCGLCFGVGYSMGSRSAQGASTAGLQPGVVASSPSAGSLLKPSAVAQNIPLRRSPSWLICPLPGFPALLRAPIHRYLTRLLPPAATPPSRSSSRLCPPRQPRPLPRRFLPSPPQRSLPRRSR